jgi:Holliday junction resolvase RusA-like endonuclease
MIQTFTLKGLRVISKKNSRNVFVRGGRQFNIPSKAYKDFVQEAGKQLLTIKKLSLKAREVLIDFEYKGKLSLDIDNAASSILDLLMELRIIEDDKYIDILTIHVYRNKKDWNTAVTLSDE